MWIPLALALTSLLAFAAGFLLKVRSRHWCKACGGTLRCPDCTGRLTAPGRRV